MSRLARKIHPRLDRKVAAYAAASTASGVVGLSTAQSAEATEADFPLPLRQVRRWACWQWGRRLWICGASGAWTEPGQKWKSGFFLRGATLVYLALEFPYVSRAVEYSEIESDICCCPDRALPLFADRALRGSQIPEPVPE
jgi:hypothetical protein